MPDQIYHPSRTPARQTLSQGEEEKSQKSGEF